MLNIKSTNSPISVIHEDTKLILEALKNIDLILENKPVRVPLLITDEMILIEDRNKDTATFVGLMLLDFDNNFYFVEDATYLFSYVFLNPYNERYKQTFLEQLEKWFAYKERVVSIKNDIIITLILREDLELNFDKKLIDLLNKNPMNVLDNVQVYHEGFPRDVIWNSILFNLNNIDFIDLMKPIVNACDCKFLY